MGAASSSGGWFGEVGGKSPTPNGEEDLEGTVLLFEEVELLEAAVEVVTYVVPGVAIEVDIFVCPQVCEVAVINVRSCLKDCDEVDVLFFQYIRNCIEIRVTRSCAYTSPLSGRTLAKA